MTAAQLESSSPPLARRALIVDDDAEIRRTLERLMKRDGWETVTADDGLEALALIRDTTYDVVVSDVSMPGMDGLALLREIRACDLDVPVLLVTGEPSLERATAAVEYGAFRFLSKPVDPAELARAMASALVVGRTLRVRRDALDQLDGERRLRGDLATVDVHLNRALEKLWIAFQPIVSWSERRIVAYEALVRSREESLPHPGALLDAAERLNRMPELGRRIRECTAPSFAGSPEDTRLFVNLHTSDLDDELLLSSDGPLFPLASRITLEITERAALPPLDLLLPKLARLRAAGYRIALDDLGAGYSGLSSFAWLDPEVVKLDMSIVRDIDTSPVRQKLAQSMFDLCRDLGRQIIAEGVETAAECEVLTVMGYDLFQGYFFARPGPPFPDAKFGG